MGNYSGSESSFPDYSLCDAYCEGRKASVGGVAIGAAAANGGNPHVANTPEWLAWRRGHIMYASGGANTVADNCASPTKFDTPATTNAVDETDVTGATHSFTPNAPGLPFLILFGDGTNYENLPGSVDPILHQYKESGTYSVRLVMMDKVWASYSIEITIV